MYVDDFDCNANRVITEAELLARLRIVRRGQYGAFFLYHEDPHPLPLLAVLFGRDAQLAPEDRVHLLRAAEAG